MCWVNLFIYALVVVLCWEDSAMLFRSVFLMVRLVSTLISDSSKTFWDKILHFCMQLTNECMKFIPMSQKNCNFSSNIVFKSQYQAKFWDYNIDLIVPTCSTFWAVSSCFVPTIFGLNTSLIGSLRSPKLSDVMVTG